MVSLENTRNPKGGFSFEAFGQTNEEVIETNSVINFINPSADTLPLTVETEPGFKQIKTTFLIVLQILIVILFETGVFIVPILCGENDKNCTEFGGFDLYSFIHAGLWLIKLLFDRIYHYHHMKSRRHGYLSFYRNTRTIRSLPLIIVSAGNSILIILIKILNKYCPTKCTSANLSPMNFLQIYVSIESALLLIILVYYLILTVKFNRTKKSPDISSEMDRPIFLPSQLKDLGYKDSNYISTILENQADMIRYLQEKNDTLTHKLYNKSEKANLSNIN